MWNKILEWIKGAWNKMFSRDTIKQALRVDIAASPVMLDALNLWDLIYKNQASWLNSEIQSLNLGAAIASEIARAVTIEMSVEVSGSPRADFLNEQMEIVVDAMRKQTEFAAAKGGLMLKPYINGNNITVDYVQADQFFPVAFDANGKMTACIFVDQKTIGQSYYTRLESHALVGTTYTITNTAFKSSTQNTLGNQITSTVFEDVIENGQIVRREFISIPEIPEWHLQVEMNIAPVEKPLFAYFKMPMANNIDPTSPLGVSTFSRAAHAGSGKKCLLQQADETWSAFLWELESGKRAVFTTPDAFNKDADGKPIIPDKRLYRLLDLAAIQIDKPGFFADWTPTIRHVELLNSLNSVLRQIEFVCGMSYGTISNPDTVALTATEIKSAKQRYYVTVTDTQKALEDALEHLAYAMDVWATLGNLAPRGTYDIVCSFDDSIVADHDAQFTQDSSAVGMQVMSKLEFRMRNYGESLEVAQEKLALVQKEQAAIADLFGTNNPGV